MFRAVKLLCDVTMVDTRHFVQTHVPHREGTSCHLRTLGDEDMSYRFISYNG